MEWKLWHMDSQLITLFISLSNNTQFSKPLLLEEFVYYSSLLLQLFFLFCCRVTHHIRCVVVLVLEIHQLYLLAINFQHGLTDMEVNYIWLTRMGYLGEWLELVEDLKLLLKALMMVKTGKNMSSITNRVI
jgi:hypothetical protein